MKIICIGGPLDGKIVDREPTDVFLATDEKPPTLWERVIISNAAAGEHFLDQAKTQTTEYTLRSLAENGKPVLYFYTSEGISEVGALVRVFNAYVKEKQ